MRLRLEFDELKQQIKDRLREFYSEKVVDHTYNPRNVGRIKNADGFARITGPCGDTMEITLRVKGLTEKRIIDLAFWTDGCGTSIACGSMTTEIVRGKTIAEAMELEEEQILSALGGLPESDVHCAVLASNTLREAIKDYMTSRNKRERTWPPTPAEVKKIEGDMAEVDFGNGVLRKVHIPLVQVEIGEYVLVQEGYATQVLDKKKAQKLLQSWNQLLGYTY